MQQERDGLGGNMISSQRLSWVLTAALNDRCITNPKIAARQIRRDLAERDFMLCFVGDGQFAFVHRAFLEYFCAREYISHLANGGTEAELVDLFRARGRDEAWSEVLRLACAMAGPDLAAKLIGELQVASKENLGWRSTFLAAECAAEVRQKARVQELRAAAYRDVLALVDYLPGDDGINEENMQIRTGAVERLASLWPIDETRETLRLIMGRRFWAVRFAAAESLVKYDKGKATRQWFIDHLGGSEWLVPQAAVHGLAFGWPDESTRTQLLRLLKSRSGDPIISTIMRTLSEVWPAKTTREWLIELVNTDPRRETKWQATNQIATRWHDDETRRWLVDRIKNASSQEARNVAAEHLARRWPDKASREILLQMTGHGNDPGARHAALLALADSMRTPEIRSSLERQLDDTKDPDLRADVVQTLAFFWRDEESKVLAMKLAREDKEPRLRLAAFIVLARFWVEEESILHFLCERLPKEPDVETRLELTRFLVWISSRHKRVGQILSTIRENEPDPQVRKAANEDLASHE